MYITTRQIHDNRVYYNHRATERHSETKSAEKFLNLYYNTNQGDLSSPRQDGKERHIMKVQITKDAKKWLTVAEMPTVRQLQKDFASGGDWDTNLNETVKMLARNLSFDSVEEIYTATAQIAKNQRIENYYNENSGDLDIWIEATYKTYDEFFVVGAYLSDIWLSDGTPETKELIKSRAYIQEYKRV